MLDKAKKYYTPKEWKVYRDIRDHYQAEWSACKSEYQKSALACEMSPLGAAIVLEECRFWLEDHLLLNTRRANDVKYRMYALYRSPNGDFVRRLSKLNHEVVAYKIKSMIGTILKQEEEDLLMEESVEDYIEWDDEPEDTESPSDDLVEVPHLDHESDDYWPVEEAKSEVPEEYCLTPEDYQSIGEYVLKNANVVESATEATSAEVEPAEVVAVEVEPAEEQAKEQEEAEMITPLDLMIMERIFRDDDEEEEVSSSRHSCFAPDEEDDESEEDDEDPDALPAIEVHTMKDLKRLFQMMRSE